MVIIEEVLKQRVPSDSNPSFTYSCALPQDTYDKGDLVNQGLEPFHALPNVRTALLFILQKECGQYMLKNYKHNDPKW